MLLMMCDMCSLEHRLAAGEPRWCGPDGTGRTEPGECTVRDTVAGVRVGCFPDLYTALSGNMPDQAISLYPGPRTGDMARRARDVSVVNGGRW